MVLNLTSEELKQMAEHYFNHFKFRDAEDVYAVSKVKAPKSGYQDMVDGVEITLEKVERKVEADKWFKDYVEEHGEKKGDRKYIHYSFTDKNGNAVTGRRRYGTKVDVSYETRLIREALEQQGGTTIIVD